MILSERSTDARTILLVEDDVELASLIQEFLRKNGFDVTIVGNGLEAITRILESPPDLVVLDVMLPGISGMDVCREVRTQFHSPILMLTALDEDIDQMLGLELGADDYVIKPVKPRLLLSRIRALLRRAERTLHPRGAGATVSESNPEQHKAQHPPAALRISAKTRGVWMNQEALSLTTAEFELLLLLAEAAGQIVSRDTIVQSLRGFDYDGLDRSIDRRISRLRKKLNDDPVDPQLIKTVRGKGYLLGITPEIER